jgi:hypothetical protein
MRKPLLNFLVFVISATLLFGAYSFGQGGSRVGAAIVLAILVAWMLFWNTWSGRWLAKPPPTDCETSEASAAPANRKATINSLGVLYFGLWLVAISIGTGVFGRSPDLSYIAAACAVIGLGVVVIIRFLTKNSQ